MRSTPPVSAATGEPPPGGQGFRRPGGGGPAAGTLAAVRAAAREPFTTRAVREFLFCLAGVPLGYCLIVVPLVVAAAAGTAALLAPGVVPLLSAVTIAGLLLLIMATRIARGLGAVHRRLAAELLGDRVAAAAPRRGRGMSGWLGAGLRDGPGWRAVAYLLLKLPVAAFEFYGVFLWAAGVANLSYPFWWGMFRYHPPDVQLRPVPASTPFPGREFQVGSFPGTFLALAAGAAMVLAAPWVTRAVVAVDRWLIRSLLGPGGLAQRVRDLEETRARAVDDSAAMLRRVERDLHDGAQVRLAALALNLGMAREKLGGDPPADLTLVRDLVDAAHRGAKEALAELRDLAKGIHPPVLDNGLADALATLAAGSAIPTELITDIPVRPTAAIETIAYFCAAELLANAAKHSGATKVRIDVAERDVTLRLRVTDDGTGGADPGRGSGLAGLAQRARTVDGRLSVASPAGGPTEITVELPLRAGQHRP